MPIIDIYVGDDEQQRKRRRGKWLIPLLVGIGGALAVSQEKPPSPTPPKPVVAAPLAVVQPPAVAVEPTLVEAPAAPPPVPARIAVAPLLLDFGDGPLTPRLPAQLATTRNQAHQALAPPTPP